MLAKLSFFSVMGFLLVLAMLAFLIAPAMIPLLANAISTLSQTNSAAIASWGSLEPVAELPPEAEAYAKGLMLLGPATQPHNNWTQIDPSQFGNIQPPHKDNKKLREKLGDPDTVIYRDKSGYITDIIYRTKTNVLAAVRVITIPASELGAGLDYLLKGMKGPAQGISTAQVWVVRGLNTAKSGVSTYMFNLANAVARNQAVTPSTVELLRMVDTELNVIDPAVISGSGGINNVILLWRW